MRQRASLRPLILAALCATIVSTLLLLACAHDLVPSSAVGATTAAPNALSKLKHNVRALKTVIKSALENTTLTSSCRDKDRSCASWAMAGECSGNAIFMNASCPRSCGLCPGGGGPVQTNAAKRSLEDCKDTTTFCGQWAAVGECDSNPVYMHANCPVTCHLCQSTKCHDADEARCAAEAARGLCRKEPERMYSECRWACKWCAMETGSRCRRQADDSPAARRGTLAAMFERSISDPLLARYTPIIHSRDPWIVSFETFLSGEEAERIIKVGGRGWSRSQAGDGVQAVRTSSTAWCDAHHCASDPILARIRKRIANLTLVPERNAEHMQVLKYEQGQFYRTHHDQNSPMTSAWGPRMYTFFMYLNDGAGGGETHFPRLNISVEPRRGRALLWPSVLDHDPNERDDRTEHEAVTVSRGVKFAANYWLHMYDFDYAVSRGCGNTEVFGNW